MELVGDGQPGTSTVRNCTFGDAGTSNVSVDNAAEVKFKEYRQDQQGFMFDVAEARHDKMLGLYIDSQKDVAALRENYAANNGRVIDSD